MNEDDAKNTIAMIQSNYPNFYTKQTAEQAGVMARTWLYAFAPYDKNIVINALMAVIMTKKEFPPTIAEVNEQVIKMVLPTETLIDGERAWGAVQSLIKQYGTYISDEQKAELNKDVDRDIALKQAIRACGGLEVFRLCEMDNLNTLRAQFIKIYNSYNKRKAEQMLIPDNIKSEMQKIADRHMPKEELKQITEDRQNIETASTKETALQSIAEILKNIGGGQND